MCYYITVTLPKNTKLEEIKQIITNYSMGFTPVSNKYVESQLKAGDYYLRATKSYCDCDTALGSLNITEKYEELLNSKKFKTLKKKGWSKAQIDEWLANHKRKLEDKQKERRYKTKHYPERDEREVNHWRDFLGDLLNASLPRVGLLKHWYVGGLESEEFSIKHTQQISLTTIDVKFLMYINEDVLYEFVK